MNIADPQNRAKIAILEHISDLKMNVDFGNTESVSVTHRFYGTAKFSETEKQQLIEFCKKGDELNS